MKIEAASMSDGLSDYFDLVRSTCRERNLECNFEAQADDRKGEVITAIILSFTVSIAANAAYDILKSCFARMSQRRSDLGDELVIVDGKERKLREFLEEI